MTAPSVVLAEATWYGSFRTGIDSSSGNTTIADFGSRFGVRGSNELSDGLSSVYRFEHKLNTSNASLSGGGRLSYVGLSGGFGTLTMGQIWGASYNNVGALVDNIFNYGYWLGTYRTGNALSYAMSAGAVSLQVDAVMNDGDKTIDMALLGTNFDFGAGKGALSYERDSATKDTKTGAAVSFGFGPITGFLGGARHKIGDAKQETVLWYGLSGSVGDSGISYALHAAKREKFGDDAAEGTRIGLGLSRSLGTGTSIKFEVQGKDKVEGQTKASGLLALKVDF